MIAAEIRADGRTRGTEREKFGRGFKGLITYLLHGHADTADNPERVTLAQTVNLFGDVYDAAQELRLTADYRAALLKRAPTLDDEGRDVDGEHAAYHFILSWKAEEEPPTPEGMADHAREVLRRLGLGEHEAVLIAHGDTANPHIHVVANRVNPTTGRLWKSYRAQNVMNDYAADWMKANGLELWQQGQGHGQREHRKAWERKQAARLQVQREALPLAILQKLTANHSTFTAAQLAAAVTANTTTPQDFADLLQRVRAHAEFVELGDDPRGAWVTKKGGYDALDDEQKARAVAAWQEWKAAEAWHSFDLREYVAYVQERTEAAPVKRYTTKAQLAAEARLAGNAGHLAGTTRHTATDKAKAAALAKFAGAEQEQAREALAHLLDGRGLSVVVGYAGAGKSTLLRTAAEAWKSSGFKPRGLGRNGTTAEALATDTSIEAATVAGFLGSVAKGYATIDRRDVFIIDEAGLLGSSQLDQLLHHIREAGAKAVLVGDPEQLQAIEAGGALSYIVNHYEHARLSKIWRQREEWQRAATRDLAEGKTAAALDAYASAGMVQEHTDRAAAVEALLDQWQAGRDVTQSQIIMTATNDEARAINEAARGRLAAAGVLGFDRALMTAGGLRNFATGDRVLFRRNEYKDLNVKNGTAGTVLEINGTALTIRTEQNPPRVVVVDLRGYNHIEHGYAVPIARAQGVTVDRAHVLASRNMDRHAAYVAMSRHRERVALHWTREDFADSGMFTRALSRKRLKDTALDYLSDVRAVVDGAGQEVAPTDDARAVIRWGNLYQKHREEAERVGKLEGVARAFWYAVNAGRFIKAKALTLEQMHEAERVSLAADMQKDRPKPTRRTRPTKGQTVAGAPTKSHGPRLRRRRDRSHSTTRAS